MPLAQTVFWSRCLAVVTTASASVDYDGPRPLQILRSNNQKKQKKQ